MCEVFAANTTREAIAPAIQCTGGSGSSEHLPRSGFYRSVRAFRIVDGAAEVHRPVFARDGFDEANPNPEELETSRCTEIPRRRIGRPAGSRRTRSTDRYRSTD